MSLSRQPQSHTNRSPSYKRPFDDINIDPPDSLQHAGGSGPNNVLNIDSERADRHKRARSESDTSDNGANASVDEGLVSSESFFTPLSSIASSSSSQASSLYISHNASHISPSSSFESMHTTPPNSPPHIAPLNLEVFEPPSLEDTHMHPDGLPSASAPNEDSFEASMERYNAFDSNISVLRGNPVASSSSGSTQPSSLSASSLFGPPSEDTRPSSTQPSFISRTDSPRAVQPRESADPRSQHISSPELRIYSTDDSPPAAADVPSPSFFPSSGPDVISPSRSPVFLSEVPLASYFLDSWRAAESTQHTEERPATSTSSRSQSQTQSRSSRSSPSIFAARPISDEDHPVWREPSSASSVSDAWAPFPSMPASSSLSAYGIRGDTRTDSRREAQSVLERRLSTVSNVSPLDDQPDAWAAIYFNRRNSRQREGRESTIATIDSPSVRSEESNAGRVSRQPSSTGDQTQDSNYLEFPRPPGFWSSASPTQTRQGDGYHLPPMRRPIRSSVSRAQSSDNSPPIDEDAPPSVQAQRLPSLRDMNIYAANSESNPPSEVRPNRTTSNPSVTTDPLGMASAQEFRRQYSARMREQAARERPVEPPRPAQYLSREDLEEEGYELPPPRERSVPSNPRHVIRLIREMNAQRARANPAPSPRPRSPPARLADGSIDIMHTRIEDIPYELIPPLWRRPHLPRPPSESNSNSSNAARPSSMAAERLSTFTRAQPSSQLPQRPREVPQTQTSNTRHNTRDYTSVSEADFVEYTSTFTGASPRTVPRYLPEVLGPFLLDNFGRPASETPDYLRDTTAPQANRRREEGLNSLHQRLPVDEDRFSNDRPSNIGNSRPSQAAVASTLGSFIDEHRRRANNSSSEGRLRWGPVRELSLLNRHRGTYTSDPDDEWMRLLEPQSDSSLPVLREEEEVEALLSYLTNPGAGSSDNRTRHAGHTPAQVSVDLPPADNTGPSDTGAMDEDVSMSEWPASATDAPHQADTFEPWSFDFMPSQLLPRTGGMPSNYGRATETHAPSDFVPRPRATVGTSTLPSNDFTSSQWGATYTGRPVSITTTGTSRAEQPVPRAEQPRAGRYSSINLDAYHDGPFRASLARSVELNRRRLVRSGPEDVEQPVVPPSQYPPYMPNPSSPRIPPGAPRIPPSDEWPASRPWRNPMGPRDALLPSATRPREEPPVRQRRPLSAWVEQHRDTPTDSDSSLNRQALNAREHRELHDAVLRRVRHAATRVADSMDTDLAPLAFPGAGNIQRQQQGNNNQRERRNAANWGEIPGDDSTDSASRLDSLARWRGRGSRRLPRYQARQSSHSPSRTSDSRSDSSGAGGRVFSAWRRRAAAADNHLAEISGRYARIRGRALGDYVRDEDFDASYEGLLQLTAVLGEARPRRTAQNIIDSLPSGTYRDWATAGESDERCPICLDDYSETDPLLKISNCTHWFHKGCLVQWLKTANTCPVCRGRVDNNGRPRTSQQGPADAGPSSRRERNSSDDRDEDSDHGELPYFDGARFRYPNMRRRHEDF